MVCVFGMKKGCCNSKIHTKLHIYNLVCTSSEKSKGKMFENTYQIDNLQNGMYKWEVSL